MKELFARCIPFNETIKGRLGGNPPIVIEKLIPDEYKFYATINHPEKENIMLSVLIHRDFDVLLKNNIYPSIDIKIIEHEYASISDNSEKSILDLGCASISNYNELQDEYLFIKVGGEPRLIQPKDYYYEELEKNDYSFFLQIDEEGYIEGMEPVFMYGAVYLYKHNQTGEIIAGFWQYS